MTPETSSNPANGIGDAGGTPALDSAEFRKKLVKIMPGFNWTVHRAGKGAVRLTATGIQSSGFNRCATLEVTFTVKNGVEWYTAKSAGFGTRAPWLGENGDVTLARALRGLQDQYRAKAATFDSAMRVLANARIPTPPEAS